MAHLYWAIGIFGSAFFALILFAIIYKMLEVRAARNWLATPGTVVDSRVVARKLKPGDFGFNQSPTGNVGNFAFVQYEYVVDGKKFRCDRVSIAEHSANDEVEAMLERYPVGTAVTVYYNPKRPNQAVIERELPAGMGYGIILLLLIFGGGPLVLLFATTNAAEWIAPLVVNKDRIPVVVLVTGMGLFTIMLTFVARRQAADARTWPSVQGQVVSSTTDRFRTYMADSAIRPTMYVPSVVYVYQVNGRHYAGDRVSFGGVVSASRVRVFSNKLARYPEGAEVEVFYNPANPAESVLERRVAFQFVLWIVAVALLGFAYAIARGKLN